MALPSLTFLAGILVLAYLASFVLFAFIRIATGISIQRVGYSGLRRIAYTPRDGVKIELRGLGFSLHRPTFAQPTWISVVLTELKITVDLQSLGVKNKRRPGWVHWSNGSADKLPGASAPSTPGEESDAHDHYDGDRGRTWEKLTDIKEKIKRLHRKIHWIRLVDVVATTSSVVVVDVGSVQVSNFTIAVDTRRRTVDRNRLFRHLRHKTDERKPAEWISTVRGILFTPHGGDSTEILDHCALNIHGLLYKELDGLRDASISLKLGRLSIPYDDIQIAMDRSQRRKAMRKRRGTGTSEPDLHDIPDISFSDVVNELDRPGSREENIVRTVSDSKDFIASTLRGIQEIQFAVSFLGLTKRIRTGNKGHSSTWFNFAMKEVGLDLERLDPRSPAHLQYFSSGDVAHQALFSAISVSAGLDNGHGTPERLLYIPMATTTVRTTLPSKTIQLQTEKNVAERNANILYANVVATSPSLDVAPKHLPLVLELLKNHESSTAAMPAHRTKRNLISRLLPKASIKMSIHEPVVRVTLPPMEASKHGTEEFDLLISAMSSVSLDLESSHSAGGDLHYSLSSIFRVSSHQLYYQTASIEKHDLLRTDEFEVKVQLSASPEVCVFVNGNLQTFSVFMVRPEIAEGIRQIVAQLRSETSPVRRYHQTLAKRQCFLRKLPPWLVHVQLAGSDFSVEVAGIDEKVSKDPRGIALHLGSWNAEYKADREEPSEPRPTRRRATSRTISREEFLLRPATPTSPRRKLTSATDGRRLAVHVQSLEGFVVESADTWEPDPFLNLPRFEVAFSTSSDPQGPKFHVNSFAKSLYLHYSMYRHFAIAVAALVLKKTFQPEPVSVNARSPTSPLSPQYLNVPGIQIEDVSDMVSVKPELTTIDFKAAFLQIKATMPADPPLMLQIQDFDAGRHRWQAPFARARLARLYADTPKMPGIWSRLISIKSIRVDFRALRQKKGQTYTDEKSIDVATDAVRLAIPHQLVVHKIFDNFANIVKTVKQLHHRFQTNSNEDVLQKEPEGPKHVPRISLRSQAVLFEIEDGSFEWKLGVIYRLGLLEQKQRLAREEAFRLKKKKLEELARHRGSGSSKFRAKSAHDGGRSKTKRSTWKYRSKSHDRSEGSSPGRHGRKMRYDTEGKADMSGAAHTDIEKAQEKLDRLNAQSWKKRIDHGLACQTRAMKDIRSIFWGLDEMPDDDNQQKEVIMAIPQRPALMAMLVSDFNFSIDKPSFPIAQYSKFLHRVGKGMPYDQQYSLLIPMHVSISMGEARVTLRDYPLPLLHVPAIRAGQSPRLQGLLLKTDFVIAEEYRDSESSRFAHIVVVPPEMDEAGNEYGGYAVDVPRTVTPVKTYSDMTIEINSSAPTRITWGSSYQPAIQDMMQVIESFTKPAVDPSERVGFWDKIRLSFHSRLNVAWRGDGDVHFIMKGSRDPYMVTGVGAGFVMCWRNNVRWSICQHQDPRKFMTVESGSFVLAIPDLSHYARMLVESQNTETESISSTSTHNSTAAFKKTIMKLSGKVQWLAGLMFERNLDGERNKRSFDFIPHYKVVLKNPKFAKCTQDKVYDAFRGFRSHHIHLSIAISAPHDRDWSLTNLEPSPNYNSLHLSPRFFSHFYSWWAMFSGVMALPIRQGKLWPGIEKSSKKFGRHLATIKYNLLLSPLYMSHVYKYKDGEGSETGSVSATGLKVRLDSFMLDLHQRREEFRTQLQVPKRDENDRNNMTTGMKINQAQLDFIAADIRAISAVMSPANIDPDANEMVGPHQTEGSNSPVDLSNFTIPDKDLKWIDMDDFVELDWVGPPEVNPRTKILPLAYAPRFTYFRQTDHEGHISGDPHRYSSFGNEPTHYCVISRGNDPRRVQRDLVHDRLKKVQSQLSHNEREVGQQELEIIRSTTNHEQTRQKLSLLKQHSEALRCKLEFLQKTRDSLDKKLMRSEDLPSTSDSDSDETKVDEYYEAPEKHDPQDQEVKGMDNAPFADYVTDFNNRFIVHNVQLKWNNSLRDIIVRYVHQVSQRRGFVYYMSRNAVKFILDIIKEQEKMRHHDSDSGSPSPTQQGPMSPDDDDDLNVQDRIQQLIDDTKKFVDADDPEHTEEPNVHRNAANNDIAVEYTAQNSYHVRLIAPQIQLQSEKNRQSAVLVTAKGIQLKVIQIMDKERVADTVSGLVQRRFTAAMDSVQMFVTSSRTFSTEYLHMYSGNRYGAPHGKSWPPWVPFEAMFEFELNPYGFERVVQRTSASLRFDKYNNLRLKHSDDVTGSGGHRHSPDSHESRMDHIWIDFPQFRAVCDSNQYYALYIMVLDLLLYNEPLEKTRTERLEKIMLASDFSDLTGAPEMVIMLQERIRQLEEIKTHFQIHEKYLDKQGWKDRVGMEQDLAACEDELFFMMKAITTAQQRQEDRYKTSQAAEGILRWYIGASEIVWHVLQSGNKPLAEFQLKDALFDRTDNNDGSNYNNVEIGQIQGLNLLEDASYPEMISPFIENDKIFADGRDTKMLRVNWHMLEAIGGIPVMSSFEVNLFPLKVQLEKEVGVRLFEYIFPKNEQKGLDQPVESPFMVKRMMPDGDESEDERIQSSSNIPSIEFDHVDDSYGPGSLELRLQPTLNLSGSTARRRSQESTRSRTSSHGLGLFRDSFSHASRANSIFRNKAANDVSTDTLVNSHAESRPTSHRTPSTFSRRTASNKASMDEDRPSRFRLTRTNTSDKEAEKEKQKQRSDDLTQMMSRASNYVSYAYIKIPSVVLCLSYKGKGQRNFEDVHDLVFRLPTLEYRNKMWSNLDLALQFKKDAIRALISHAGAIVGNKFSHHRPSKTQQSKLRQIANSSALLSNTALGHSIHVGPNPLASRDHSEDASHHHHHHHPTTDSTNPNSETTSLSEPRRSFASGRQGSYISTSQDHSQHSSYPSSLHSSIHIGPHNESHPHHSHSSGPIPHDHQAYEYTNAEAVSFADELSRVDPMEPETIRRSLQRHLTTLSHKVGSVAHSNSNSNANWERNGNGGQSNGRATSSHGSTHTTSVTHSQTQSQGHGHAGAGASGPGAGAGGNVTTGQGSGRTDRLEEDEESTMRRKGRALLEGPKRLIKRVGGGGGDAAH